MSVKITEEGEDGEEFIIAHYDNRKYTFHKKGGQELEYWNPTEATHDEEISDEIGYPPEVKQYLNSQGYTILN